MFCSNCGKALREGAKFCGYCGTPVEILDAGGISVPDDTTGKAETPIVEAGKLLTGAGSVTSEPVKDATSEQATAPVSAKDFIPGTELYKFKMVEKTMGTASITTRVGTGTLHVYNNGLKFSSILGADAGNGMLRTITSAAINITQGLYDSNTYPLEQIQELSVGKRMGVYNTLVITMKNGDVWSFCPAVPKSSAPKQIISILKPYMDKLIY